MHGLPVQAGRNPQIRSKTAAVAAHPTAIPRKTFDNHASSGGSSGPTQVYASEKNPAMIKSATAIHRSATQPQLIVEVVGGPTVVIGMHAPAALPVMPGGQGQVVTVMAN